MGAILIGIECFFFKVDLYVIIVSLLAKLKMSLKTRLKIYYVTLQIVKRKKISLRLLQ